MPATTSAARRPATKSPATKSASEKKRENAARRDGHLDNLFDAILTLRTKAECRDFFRDLLTQAELKECSARWLVVRHLAEGTSYRDISEITGLSTATITRVARWSKRGCGGYQLALKRLQKL